MKRGSSVIVPVYNTEKYIVCCVKSVLEQTYTDFELLLIDDGSQDASKGICEKLCRNDKRIRLIHQKHRGVSAARNAGIEAAEGKYLFFLDSDDAVHPQLLEALYNLQEKNHTVIATTGLYYAKKGEFQKPANWRLENSYKWESYYLDSDRARNPMFFNREKIHLGAIGGKMILREGLKTVRFDEKMIRCEDTWFLFQLLSNGADVMVLLRDWYYYRTNNGKENVEYSVESRRTIYECRKLMCDYEMKKNRVSEAVNMEWCLLCDLVSWYEIGGTNKDIELREYVKGLIKDEKKSDLFCKVDWYRKLVFYLGCTYYPLYKLIADFISWYHNKYDIPSEIRHNMREAE